ncbi:MAG TPA: S1 family peptidase [Streptomyces sp.]|nr:S1 family peptidase [Streptomyces sp.]
MKHQRTLVRRMVIAGVSAVMLLLAPLTSTGASAMAGSVMEPLSDAEASTLATTLAHDLKDGVAGAYYEAGEKKLVVNVVDESVAEKVRQAGAEARIVQHTLAQLGTVREGLTDGAVPGTARAIDHRLNKVVVTADSTVRGDALAELRKQVAAQGDKAVLKRSPGQFAPLLLGGDTIWNGGVHCSLGFNVTRNGLPYFLTAGHCAGLYDRWSTTRGGGITGITVASSFPGNDHSLVRYATSTDHPSAVNLHNGTVQAITRAADPIVGQQVQRSGSTTGVRSGEVMALGVSVTYPQGTVGDLIQANVCAEPGDSGGPLFSGTTAHGLTSGGIGDCRRGGTTFYQPVTEALQTYGARIG